ncbi:glycosyltransferase family 2 protein [Thermaerobacter sp. PB12/4term]|uniref:glycosyltransferase family 2 protein n=1 Tax=Thermaerobacter sp. PB12/4term TaxID=2293838 RepID=UPI001FAE54D9|nr:glycosyltransferase family 2 protein [Thermaerobacter sp. PB12/4term]
MPVFNEERYISRCLDSVLANDYPKDRMEILVIDGNSSDRSREIVQEYAMRYSFIRILDNPKRFVASALNIGLMYARGDIIIRMDAHSTYDRRYISQCVRLLQHSEASNVGGVMRAVGEGYWGETIAIAVTTPFGVGNAYYRFSQCERWVDTVFPGAWKKSTLEQLGGFKEDWMVNEDYELNYRLRKAGGKILLSPNIRCWYWVRPTIKAVAQQYFRYGFWRAKTLVAHPGSLRWRQVAPPALVAMLIISGFVAPVIPLMSILFPAAYLATSVIASVAAAYKRGWRYLPGLPLVYVTLHVSWGLGFYAGLCKWGGAELLGSSRYWWRFQR